MLLLIVTVACCSMSFAEKDEASIPVNKFKMLPQTLCRMFSNCITPPCGVELTAVLLTF